MPTENLIDLAVKHMESSKKMTNKQQRILETAIKMFAEKGYASTSTSEIAKAAEVAEGTIFKHFGSKENLLFSVMLPFLVKWVPVLADEFISEVLKKPYETFEAVLHAVIENRMTFLEHNKEIFKIVIAELLYRDEIKAQFGPFFAEVAAKYFYDILDTFKKKGQLIDLPNPTLLRIIATQILGYAITRFAIFSDIKWDDPNEVDNLVQVILRGIGKSTN